MILRWPLALLCAAVLWADEDPQKLMDEGHYKRARALVEARFRANPNDPATLCALSRVKQAGHDLAAAQQYAENAVAADPKNPAWHLQLAEAIGEEAEHAGTLKQIGLGRRFKKEIDATVALDPKNAKALTYLMEFYYEAPGIVGGDKAKARSMPERIVAIDPVQGYIAKLWLAGVEHQTGHAEEYLKAAVDARPDSYRAHMEYGNFILSQKKFAEAETEARQLLRLDRTRATGHALLASSLAYQAKWAELDPALAAAEKDVPDNLFPYFRAANASLNNGEAARAERYFRKYLTQEPEGETPTASQTHWRLGLALEKQGRKPEAVAAWKTSVQLDPNSRAKDELKRVK